ncbi:MAG TPA: hypothetical protein DCZ84_00460 [Candidatus Vogelbacteria bacterium]|uniref:VTT domain-containing protein n=1 Tax=Candidatus Vogelbacteria bacterium RIFOXYD1_FULL_51_18 TaxID=1802440 RepID=A0A1G2QJK0_9BACT|nr:MAG: Protein DedA (Protein DSG-1) [Parcubacteria group bacterium GW2011_GWC1_51_35]KKW26043.1 MAG: Protein DedA (Protein DSG-1) [Parcubacteria group bacterium GW2011_GWF2_52_12]KKW27025.1 MAG: Protein DedA (Protein DSG-1) [Parcubacteria group bacterium GW2011_GWF1_52_5]KKW34835.1 MAG: Protein DedA (Protein DSG-1) [Parcubacteria group bacterium GW2011_GWB1_53_43]OHA60824.1 MAG: hypothetical protein A2569_02640 [Candidatus Vogelbacteria bacterium RIFOXYD1_FULL_51_18]HBB65105.1 hypothetical pr
MFELFDVVALVQWGGYLGVAAIIFAESGLFFGFFLPGDSLLFTAGFLASQGYLNFWLLAPLLFIAAAAGDSVGYAFGYRVGPALFSRPDSRFFRHEHLIRTQKFFEKYGARAVVLARFMPIVRTFTPILAGVGKMRYASFLTYNLAGAGLWAVGVTGVGYFLGSAVPGIDRYLFPIIITIIIISILPSCYEYLKRK